MGSTRAALGSGGLGSGDLGSGDLGSGDLGSGDLGSGGLGSGGTVTAALAGGLASARVWVGTAEETNGGAVGLFLSAGKTTSGSVRST